MVVRPLNMVVLCPGAWCSWSLLTVIHFSFSLLGILDLVLLVLPFIYSHLRWQSHLIPVWILVTPVLFLPVRCTTASPWGSCSFQDTKKHWGVFWLLSLSLYTAVSLQKLWYVFLPVKEVLLSVFCSIKCQQVTDDAFSYRISIASTTFTFCKLCNCRNVFVVLVFHPAYFLTSFVFTSILRSLSS